MKERTHDIAAFLHDYLSDRRVPRRAVFGKTGAAGLGAALAALGAADFAGAVGPVPPPSSFTTLFGVCSEGQGSGTYTPGITNALQPIHVDGTVTFSPACTVAQNKAVTGLTFGIDMITSCSDKTDATGTGVIFYTAGQNSNWTLDSWKTSRLFGQYVGVDSGIITKGPFNGARIWNFGIRAATDPSRCAHADGVTFVSGTNVLIIAA